MAGSQQVMMGGQTASRRSPLTIKAQTANGNTGWGGGSGGTISGGNPSFGNLTINGLYWSSANGRVLVTFNTSGLPTNAKGRVTVGNWASELTYLNGTTFSATKTDNPFVAGQTYNAVVEGFGF